MYTENQQPTANSQEKNTSYASIIHLSSFIGVLVPFIPFANILAPLILWLIKKDEDEFVNKNGKSCLNFEISLLLYSFIIGIIGIISLIIYLALTFGMVIFEENNVDLLSESALLSSSIIGALILGFFAIVIFIFYVVVKIKGAIRASNGEVYRYPLAISFFKI
ncbi:MAG: DUF4870 domain-containing protein [Flavobacteriaceae bacterium]|nr:DUF4870 domain-containing protein [Flavobacteriaceae bacterium]